MRPGRATGTCCAPTGCPAWSARRPCTGPCPPCPIPDDAVLQLVELAIRGGGPDNITCIVADVVDSATALRQPGRAGSVLAGAASNGGRPTLLRTDSPAGARAPAAQPDRAAGGDRGRPRRPRAAGRGTATTRSDEPEPRCRRRWPVVTSILVLLLLLIVGGGYAGWRYTQDQYYVGDRRTARSPSSTGSTRAWPGSACPTCTSGPDIPLAGVPSSDQAAIRATDPPPACGGRAASCRTSGNELPGLQAAYAAESSTTATRTYKHRLGNYKKK